MKRYNFLIIGLAAVTLTGCKSLYGKYERPAVNTSGLIRDAVNDNDTLAVTDTTSFANIPWRSVFTDPQLQTLIEKTLANNPDLLNAALNIDMAEAQLKVAKLAFLPGITFTPQGTISTWDGQKANKTYSLPVNASWDANLFGNLTAAKRSTQVSMLQMKDYQVAVQTKLIANVANMYYTLLMLDKQLQIVTDMEKLTKDTWGIMKVQLQTVRGVRSTAVQSAESNYLSVQTQKEDIKRQIRETENSLSLVMGEQAHAISRSTLDAQSLPTTFSTGVGVQLLSNRADVHANEMALANCFYNIEVARSRFYPSLTISASGAYTNSGGMGITNPGKILLSAVGSLTQPIFMKGQLRAGLRVAEDQYKQALNTWQSSVLSAGSEVSNALVLYNASDAKSKLEQKRIAVLKKNVEDTRNLMASAGATYLEVITAQSNLLNAQLNQVQDDFSKMQAVVNLYYALGGGAK
ncbi:MAG: efflux transporter outer membrane subunit [Prevotella sp.]|nr:efflux transporter outer membrane subunit [Prevotella sp.]MDD7190032.1 efflux transporter outer membrane subunit [Prevotella sp.]MDY5314217.1 efflux transporter outer membrane subunit [Prevotella sp.]